MMNHLQKLLTEKFPPKHKWYITAEMDGDITFFASKPDGGVYTSISLYPFPKVTLDDDGNDIVNVEWKVNPSKNTTEEKETPEYKFVVERFGV